jgi:hypothetical protein
VENQSIGGRYSLVREAVKSLVSGKDGALIGAGTSRSAHLDFCAIQEAHNALAWEILQRSGIEIQSRGHELLLKIE